MPFLPRWLTNSLQMFKDSLSPDSNCMRKTKELRILKGILINLTAVLYQRLHCSQSH